MAQIYNKMLLPLRFIPPFAAIHPCQQEDSGIYGRRCLAKGVVAAAAGGLKGKKYFHDLVIFMSVPSQETKQQLLLLSSENESIFLRLFWVDVLLLWGRD